ncbi:Uma2 family endonuclease [Clostridium botulinum]|nr:Uma2 family endonuclease [Clostridium botulinum]
MNYDYVNNYSEEEFEDIQAHYDGKAEYDNGLIFLNSTTPIKHSQIKRNILIELSIYLKGSKCQAYDEQIEVIFNYKDDIRKYKPDIFIMCEDATKKGESFTSTPKVIFEILSKSTAKFDKGRKYDTYERFGVLEYNLVEQTGFIVQHALIDGAYQIVNVYKNNDEYSSTVFSDLKINLTDIFE